VVAGRPGSANPVSRTGAAEHDAAWGCKPDGGELASLGTRSVRVFLPPELVMGTYQPRESHLCRSVADRYSRRGSWQHHPTPEGPRGEQLTFLQRQVLDLSHIPAGVGM
jgi:hypothetical protein